MRRHPNRLSTTHDDFVLNGLQRRFKRSPKRGPKNRKKRWPLLDYTIELDVGVVFRNAN